MRGLIAFAISFVLLFVVWLTQYKFFRRYGLNDNFTIWINALLLFVVLFYVYPLKFLWTLLVNLVLGFPQGGSTQGGTPVPPIEGHQIPTLLGIFGAATLPFPSSSRCSITTPTASARNWI